MLKAAFAGALIALCNYASNDEIEAFDQALDVLRAADAKHRLAYTLNRAAQLDLERGRLDDAARRAIEALDYATLLERASEMVLAHAVLASVCRANKEPRSAAEHDAAITELGVSDVAVWASEYHQRQSDT